MKKLKRQIYTATCQKTYKTQKPLTDNNTVHQHRQSRTEGKFNFHKPGRNVFLTQNPLYRNEVIYIDDPKSAAKPISSNNCSQKLKDNIWTAREECHSMEERRQDLQVCTYKLGEIEVQ